MLERRPNFLRKLSWGGEGPTCNLPSFILGESPEVALCECSGWALWGLGSLESHGLQTAWPSYNEVVQYVHG